MKTEIDLVDDVYKLLNVGEILSAMISGDVFADSKPDNFREEAIVINCLPVSADQLQKAVVNVNVHVPNLVITIDSQPDNSQPNRKRLKIISDIVISILKDALINNTILAIQSITMIREDSLNEHYLNIRVSTNSINL